MESKEQLQISMETTKIWQKEYTEREEIINGTLLKQNDHIKWENLKQAPAVNHLLFIDCF